MTRAFEALARFRFDVLVVGGGIHGLFAAHDAASRGLQVALVEARDYGSGLSFNHQRTVHGGLRSLQSGNLVKTRQQIRARGAWATMAPIHVRTLPFVMGTYRGTKRSRGRLRLGLALYDALGFDQNYDLPTPLCLPGTTVLSVGETVSRFPGIPQHALTGGAVWHDYQLVRPDRVNWLVAEAAMRAGALLVNHAEAIAPLRTPAGLVGVRVRDHLTGAEIDVEARMTLLCAGSGLPSLSLRLGFDDVPPPLVAAANLMLRQPARAWALAAPGPSGRMLTMVPWAEGTLVGTFQGASPGGPSEAFPLSIDEMVAEANAAFPDLEATTRDVRVVHRGWTPAMQQGQVTDLLPEARLVRHALRGVPGAISVVGVKFTTARAVARAAVQAAIEALGVTAPAVNDELVLPHAAPGVTAAADADGTEGFAPDITAHLDGWYGDEAMAVRQCARERGLVARLHDRSPVIEAEIAYAAAASHAWHLADVALRRTALGQTQLPALPALRRAAEIMGAVLGWSADAREAEVRAVVEDPRFPPTAR